MRTVCIYTEQSAKSRRLATQCVQSGRRFGYEVERFASVHWDEIDMASRRLGLRLRLQPHQKRQTTATHCPAFRIANGITHYRLYLACMDSAEPMCVLEHDAVFVWPLPDSVPDGVTQVSAHRRGQLDGGWYRKGIEAGRHVADGPEPDFEKPGTIHHPYTKTVGTSGYIITPGAARNMVDYIRENGVAYADILRRDIVGGLWLLIPQPVESWVTTIAYYR